jgi:hypothetical protein
MLAGRLTRMFRNYRLRSKQLHMRMVAHARTAAAVYKASVYIQLYFNTGLA